MLVVWAKGIGSEVEKLWLTLLFFDGPGYVCPVPVSPKPTLEFVAHSGTSNKNQTSQGLPQFFHRLYTTN